MVRELIHVERVDRSFGPLDVLQDINLIVNDGDRIGIVGHNGAGKTTLLNTISEQAQDVGEIEFASGIRIAYLSQIRDIEADSTIGEELGRKGRQFQELEEEIDVTLEVSCDEIRHSPLLVFSTDLMGSPIMLLI